MTREQITCPEYRPLLLYPTIEADARESFEGRLALAQDGLDLPLVR